MKTSIELIAEERKRQIEVEGFESDHDSEHTNFELTNAGLCYAHQATKVGLCMWQDRIPGEWPFEASAWKPLPKDPKSKCPMINASDAIIMLTRAAALFAAEIDRLQKNIIE